MLVLPLYCAFPHLAEIYLPRPHSYFGLGLRAGFSALGLPMTGGVLATCWLSRRCSSKHRAGSLELIDQLPDISFSNASMTNSFPALRDGKNLALGGSLFCF